MRGDFFRATHGQKGQKFTRLSLGKNTIGRVGVQVATELCLARPEIYTGHCWRRSCGTSASDSGVNVTTLMAMMGWSNPKTAMVYVKKSRLTSLSLSLYLTNVQRQNCSNPFPKSPIEKRQAVKQSEVSSSVVAKCSNTLVSSCDRAVSSETENSVFKLEESEDLGTQDLIRDLEAEAFESQTAEVEEIDFSDESRQSEQAEVSPHDGILPSSRSVERREDVERSSDIGVVSVRGLPSNPLANIDPRLLGILSNLQNSGNVTINFHFEGKQK